MGLPVPPALSRYGLPLGALLVGAMVVEGHVRFRPKPFEELPVHRRSLLRSHDGVKVRVTALTPAESRDLIGFAIPDDRIQPVWVQVVNRADVRWYLPPITVDSEYYSPLEVAWLGHRWLTPGINRQIDRHLHDLGLPMTVEPGQTRSGFIFTHRDEGAKYTSIELVGAGHGQVRRFSFLAPVPGLRTDFQKVDWPRLMSHARRRNLTDEQFRSWLERLPCCTLGGDRRTPADPLNVVLVGDRDTVFPPLARRGWHVTQALTVTSAWETARSSLFGHRYRYAPVSSLYVFGRRQDIALQKGREDVNQRNHMRLWLAPVTVNRKPVWVGQISRDIGVRLTPRTITTHKIDPAVDETRWYLLQDLFFSESLERFGLVGGVGAATLEQPRTNYTGDPYFTDGFRGVFWLTPTPIGTRSITTRWLVPGASSPMQAGQPVGAAR
jgi:hypothetical protein